MVGENKLKTPRQIRTQQVKQNILYATTKLITEYGVEYLTVNNICKTAEVSTGSFYHHFGSKDEVLAYYLIDAFDKHMADYEAIAGQDVLENVLNCYKIYNRFLLAQGFEFIKNYYTTSNNGLYSYRSFQAGKQSDLPITEKIKTFFLEGKKNGRLEQNCDIEHLIYDLSILEKGVIFDWCLCEGEYDLIEQSTRLFENYLKSIVKSEQY